MKKVLPVRRKLAIALMVCNPTYANDISGSIAASSLMSDNSRKQAESPIEERQDTYQAGLSANYTNWLVDAELDYQFYARKFAEHSQTDEEYADGSSMLMFGKKEDPASLRLQHSRRRLLATPDALDLLANQQDREIITAEPEIRKKVWGADKVYLRGQASRVSFPDSEMQNSKRNGFTLGWIHPLSRASGIQVLAQQTKITFDELPISDYSYETAMVSYAVGLRKLRYQLEAGYNQSKPEVGDKEGAPSYRLSIVYQAGYHQLDLSASRILTDTSFGNGNEEGVNPLPGNDGLNLDVDRIERSSADARWTTQVLCDRCTFYIGASVVIDNYIEKEQDSNSKFGHIGLSYAFSDAASLSLRGSQSDVDFDGEALARSYELTNTSVEYSYKFHWGLGVRLFARQEERTSEAASYTEKSYGGGLSYIF